MVIGVMVAYLFIVLALRPKNELPIYLEEE